MSSRPPVTIGVPVYNGERYLVEALKSVTDQTFADLEILVSDNASTDGTEEICRDFAARDNRVRYLRADTNRGGVWNFNRLLALASGETFRIAAADDVARPRLVEACLQALHDGGPDVVMSYPRTQIIDEHGTVTEDLHDAVPFGSAPTAHERTYDFLRAQAAHLVYGLFRTDVLRSTRGFRATVGNDVVILAEVAARGRFALVPEQLFLQRRHETQHSARGAGQVAFHAPRARARLDLPQTTLAVELWRAVLSSPLPAAERARCLDAVTRGWIAPRWRGPAGDVRRLLVGR